MRESEGVNSVRLGMRGWGPSERERAPCLSYQHEKTKIKVKS